MEAIIIVLFKLITQHDQAFMFISNPIYENVVHENMSILTGISMKHAFN